MRILAPAKINVFLRITGRRPDGYHLLDSLMVPISLCDEIEIETEKGTGSHISLRCDDPTLPTDETNLAYKAAALLCKEAQVHVGVSISLQKCIPAGAGLGGGSSDAAAVLKGLNTLLALGFNEDRLCTLAARLGADVPFFIPCRPARVQGIGEILTPVAALPSKYFVIIVPPFGVSTPWAYRRFDELPQQEGIGGSVELPNGQWPRAELLVNDLERAVIPTYPLVVELKVQLVRRGAEHALMSGSGSAVFGMFDEHMRAEQAARALEAMGKTFVVRHFNSLTELEGAETQHAIRAT